MSYLTYLSRKGDLKMKKKNEQKEWWKSKTLWVNVLALIGGLMTSASGELATGGTISFTAMMNVGLRLITKHQLK
jgi:hypothetical protein